MHAQPYAAARRWSGRAALLSLPVLASCLLGGCEHAVLNPAGPVGFAERSILLDSMAIMLAIVLPTIAATLVFAWWYRQSNTRAVYRPDFAYSGRVELIVWAIPLLTITLLGGVTWIGAHDLDPARPLPSATPALDVQVVSLDWKWLFIYPAQGVASVNQLTLPAGVPVHFLLTSASVMNTFFVPQLGSMIYTMNGMQTQLNLQADAPGTFRGMSGHYSGDGFSDMHFEVAAVSPQDFAGWVASVRGHGPSLDAASYAQLARQSIGTAPFTYGQADPALFRRIVQQAIPPGPGPRTDTPQQGVSPRTEK